MLAATFLSAISCLLIRLFPAFSCGASPQCLHFPNGVLKFPWFFQACHSFSPPLSCFFQHFPLFSSICNSLPRLPRHHSSSPCKPSGFEPQRTLLLSCKPSCSEPQRTLLSVELRTLGFFEYACLYVPSFFKALPCLHCMTFFKPFPMFRRFFQQFLPAISPCSQRFPRFPWFFQACHSIFPPIFLHFPSVLTIFLHFLWFLPTFFLPCSRDLCSRDLGGIEPHRHQIA